MGRHKFLTKKIYIKFNCQLQLIDCVYPVIIQNHATKDITCQKLKSPRKYSKDISTGTTGYNFSALYTEKEYFDVLLGYSIQLVMNKKKTIFMYIVNSSCNKILQLLV